MKKDNLQLPWTPVVCKSNKNEVNVDVWGREYRFCDTIFPSGIKTAGEDILAAPIELHAFFDGKEKPLTDTHYFSVENDDGSCEFSTAQTAENVVFNSRVRVEYDGLVRIKFCVIPFWNEEWNRYGQEDSVYRLDKLYFDIPIKKEFAELYHYYPADGGSTIVLFTQELPSGTLPEEGIKIPFKPYVWLGWNEGGLSVCCESDQNLELNDKNSAIEYIVGEEYVTLRFHLLDHKPLDWQNRKEMWADAALPIEFEYGIQATPVKERTNKRLTDFQIYHMDRTSDDIRYLFAEFEKSEEKGRELIKKIAARGAKYLLILGWTTINNYWKASDEEKFKIFVKVCHEYDVEPMLYFGYEYSTVMPDWFEKKDEYLQKNAEGRLTDGWLIKPPMPWHRSYTICLNGSYNDVFLKGILEAMDNYGVKAIYLDGTYNPWECANEAHGCGYYDKDGNHKLTYPMFGVREFAKKLYEGVHARGGIIEVHQSGTCTVPTMAFCDVSFVGECIQGEIWNNRAKFLTFDAFRAEHSGVSTGINVQFMAIRHDETKTDVETFAAITLPHGVMPMPRIEMEPLEYMGKVWKAHNDFDIANAAWRPYWAKDCPVHTNKNDTYASVYETDDAYLAVVSSIADETKEVVLSVDCDIISATDMLGKVDTDIRGRDIMITIEPYKPSMLNIRKK